MIINGGSVFYLDVDRTVADDTFARLGRHLPPFFEMGRPLFATADGQIVCADGAETVAFGLDDGGTRAWRWAELVGGLRELTFFEYGAETGRRIVGRPGDGGGGDGGGDDVDPRDDGPTGGTDDQDLAEFLAELMADRTAWPVSR